MERGSVRVAMTETGLTAALYGVCLRQTPLHSDPRRRDIRQRPPGTLSAQQVSPGQTVTALGGGQLITIGATGRFAAVGSFLRARYDACAVGSVGCQKP